jgi:hypothetical protein
MVTNENKVINYTYKAHYNHKINLWQLINLNDYPKINAILIACAYVYGWVLNLHLLDIKTFTWEFLIKGGSGVVLAVITAISVKFGTDIYTEKLKPKLFKHGKSNKTKTDKTDRNAA